MSLTMVNAVISPGDSSSGPHQGANSPDPSGGDRRTGQTIPPSLSTMLRNPPNQVSPTGGSAQNQGIHVDTRNLPNVGHRFKGSKFYGAQRGHSLRSPTLNGAFELPDIGFSSSGKGGSPHREPPKVVKEAALEAEDVARQLRDAGLVAEAAALERLRFDLMAPGADLGAKKVEARMLAEKLRAQAKEKAHTRRSNRQQAAMHATHNSAQAGGRGGNLNISGRQCH